MSVVTKGDRMSPGLGGFFKPLEKVTFRRLTTFYCSRKWGRFGASVCGSVRFWFRAYDNKHLSLNCSDLNLSMLTISLSKQFWYRLKFCSVNQAIMTGPATLKTILLLWILPEPIIAEH